MEETRYEISTTLFFIVCFFGGSILVAFVPILMALFSPSFDLGTTENHKLPLKRGLHFLFFVPQQSRDTKTRPQQKFFWLQGIAFLQQIFFSAMKEEERKSSLSFKAAFLLQFFLLMQSP